MAKIPIQGTLGPNGPFGIVEDTDVFGGLMSFPDLATRNALINPQRKQGMMAYVTATDTYYKLLASPWAGTNADWTTLNGTVTIAESQVTGLVSDLAGKASTLASAYGLGSGPAQVITLDATRQTVVADIAGAALTYRNSLLTFINNSNDDGLALAVIDSTTTEAAGAALPKVYFAVNKYGQLRGESVSAERQRFRFLSDADTVLMVDDSKHIEGANLILQAGKGFTGWHGGDINIFSGAGGGGLDHSGVILMDVGVNPDPAGAHSIQIGYANALAIDIGNTGVGAQVALKAGGSVVNVTNSGTTVAGTVTIGGATLVNNTLEAIYNAGAAVTAVHQGIGTSLTNAQGFSAVNNTAAALGAQQYSPGVEIAGRGWSTGGGGHSDIITWMLQVQPQQAASATGRLAFLSSFANGTINYVENFHLNAVTNGVEVSSPDESAKVKVANGGAVVFTGNYAAIPVFNNGTRPAANTVPAGGVIYNSDDLTLNVSDGTNWRDMAGNLT